MSAERFHHDFLVADDFINYQAVGDMVQSQNDHEVFLFGILPGRVAQKVREIHDGKELSSQLKHACTAHGFERVFLSRVHDFIDIDLRQCVVCASAADDQCWNDRQCERETNNDAGALA